MNLDQEGDGALLKELLQVIGKRAAECYLDEFDDEGNAEGMEGEEEPEAPVPERKGPPRVTREMGKDGEDDDPMPMASPRKRLTDIVRETVSGY